MRTSVICSTQEITTLPTSTPLEGTPKRYRFVLFLNTILNHIPFFYLVVPGSIVDHAEELFVSFSRCFWLVVVGEGQIIGSPPDIKTLDDAVKSFTVRSVSRRMINPAFTLSVLKDDKFDGFCSSIFPSDRTLFLKYKQKSVWNILAKSDNGYLRKWFDFMDNEENDHVVDNVLTSLAHILGCLQCFPQFEVPTPTKGGVLLRKNESGGTVFHTNAKTYRCVRIIPNKGRQGLSGPRAQRTFPTWTCN